MKTIVTGAAGFIGFHTAKALLEQGETVVGVDNFNDYYDVSLKEARVAVLGKHPGFELVRADLAERATVEALFERGPKYVIHLAAQAGVRHSLTHPYDYLESNVTAFLHLLEACRHHGLEHFVYASSSSVYGLNRKQPFSEHDGVDHPISLYAATKRSNELMAHAYADLFGVASTGLRFFTVYGPWGRPDMALCLFSKAILAGEPIRVFNHGDMQRDLTYVDDVVRGIIELLPRRPAGDPEWDAVSADPASSTAPFRVYNIGNQAPVELMRVIDVLEEALGRKAVRNLEPMQPGDVKATCADVAALMGDTGYKPSTPIEVGIPRFVEWYREYYG